MLGELPEPNEKSMHYRDQTPQTGNDKSGVSDDQALLAMSLSQQQYTGRGGNHSKEVEQFRGWNYIGITPICKMASRAKVHIYDDRIDVEEHLEDADVPGGIADPDFRWWKLFRRPSPWQTGRQLRYEAVQQLHIHGMAMIWNVKNGFGKTVARIPLPMALLQPLAPGFHKEMPDGGVRVQDLQWISRAMSLPSKLKQSHFHYMANRTISISDITLYAYPHPILRGDGYSPGTAGKSWLELIDAAETSQAEHYERGPTTKVLVTPPSDTMTDNAALNGWQRKIDQRIRESDSGVIAIPHGQTSSITVDPDAMAYGEAAQTYGPPVLALHGTNKAAAGLNDSMTYGSVAASMDFFGSVTVQSDLDLMADEDTATVQMEEGPAFTVGYDAPSYKDPELSEQQISTDIAAGSITIGEVRKARGRKPFGDARDDLPAGSDAAKQWVTPDAKEEVEAASLQPAGGVPMGGGPPTPKTDPTQPQGKLGAPAGDIGSSAPQKKSMLAISPASQPSPVIAVDLDGTLAVYDVFDEHSIGEPISESVEAVRLLSSAGMTIVIYTSRDNDSLVARWLHEHDIPFDAINANPWASSGDAKMMADVYLDDRAVSARSPSAAMLSDVLDRFTGTAWEQRIRSQIKRMHWDRKYSFLFLPVRDELAAHCRRAAGEIDAAHLTENGIEAELHITVLPQILPTSSFDFTDRMGLLSRPQFTLADHLTVFSGKDGFAVVIEATGPDMFRLRDNAEACFPHVKSEHPSYRPHVTLAYIQEQYASKYDRKPTGLPEVSASAALLTLRHPTEPDVILPLR